MKQCCYCGTIGVENDSEIPSAFVELAEAQGQKLEGVVVVNGPENPLERLRPYGPNGDPTCYPCAMKPENIETTNTQFGLSLKAALDQGTGKIVFTDDGVRPDFSSN